MAGTNINGKKWDAFAMVQIVAAVLKRKKCDILYFDDHHNLKNAFQGEKLQLQSK